MVLSVLVVNVNFRSEIVIVTAVSHALQCIRYVYLTYKILHASYV